MLLSGIFSPISTPFYPESAVYYKKLEANVERYSRTPIAGIVVQGSTGEAIFLSDEERRQVLKVAMDSAADQKVMIAAQALSLPLRRCASPNTQPPWATTSPWCARPTITRIR